MTWDPNQNYIVHHLWQLSVLFIVNIYHYVILHIYLSFVSTSPYDVTFMRVDIFLFCLLLYLQHLLWCLAHNRPSINSFEYMSEYKNE